MNDAYFVWGMFFILIALAAIIAILSYRKRERETTEQIGELDDDNEHDSRVFGS